MHAFVIYNLMLLKNVLFSDEREGLRDKERVEEEKRWRGEMTKGEGEERRGIKGELEQQLCQMSDIALKQYSYYIQKQLVEQEETKQQEIVIRKQEYERDMEARQKDGQTLIREHEIVT